MAPTRQDVYFGLTKFNTKWVIVVMTIFTKEAGWGLSRFYLFISVWLWNKQFLLM